jgi:hypothetical protein
MQSVCIDIEEKATTKKRMRVTLHDQPYTTKKLSKIILCLVCCFWWIVNFSIQWVEGKKNISWRSHTANKSFNFLNWLKSLFTWNRWEQMPNINLHWKPFVSLLFFSCVLVIRRLFDFKELRTRSRNIKNLISNNNQQEQQWIVEIIDLEGWKQHHIISSSVFSFHSVLSKRSRCQIEGWNGKEIEKLHSF